MDRVERMRHAAEGDDVLVLRDLVQALLDDGVSEDTLYEDLSATSRLLSESDEDKVLDVMDLLVGWGCEKGTARLPKTRSPTAQALTAPSPPPAHRPCRCALARTGRSA